MDEMPETFPGPNGRELKVSAAITKRMKDGPIYETMGKWPDGMRRTIRQRGLIVRCGCAGSGCRGVLGYLTSKWLACTEELRVDASGRATLREWTIVHPDRYGGYEDSGYHVLGVDRGKRSRSGARVGSRRMPARLVASDAQARNGYPGPGSRRIVGQMPTLPCIVFCPSCGMPSWIEPPEGAPPNR